MKDTARGRDKREARTMTRKPIQNRREMSAKWPKTGHKCGSFGQNEAIFRHNFFDARWLPLCVAPRIDNSYGSNDLRPIMRRGLVSIFRKYQSELQLCQRGFAF